jgi:hypothetical protein
MIVATSGISTSADWVTLPKPGQSVVDLSPAQEQRRSELKALDREVQAHEQDHKVAGGSLVRGAAQFQYTVGPDGKFYATGGKVEVDASEVKGDPRATYDKARKIEKTASGPGATEMSIQDRFVSAYARAMASKAYTDLGGGSGALSRPASTANLMI